MIADPTMFNIGGWQFAGCTVLREDGTEVLLTRGVMAAILAPAVSDFEWVTVRGNTRDPWDASRILPPSVTVNPDDWAHGVWSALAVTLAEPLRKAFGDHLDGCERCHTHGIAHCPEGDRLFRLLPAGDRVVFA